jgi:DNA-binding GntR family transcriptional regulator
MHDDSTTLADLADRHLRHDIVRGMLKPGEKLTAAALIQRYGIGASPLREALSRLSADHLVLLQGKRGFTVAPISLADLDDISRARRLVETEAVRLSVNEGDELWEARMVAAFHRLERADERLKSGAALEPELDAWEQRNRDFHEAIISACCSPWLLRLQHLLFTQHERYRRLSLGKPDPGRDLQAEHRAIMQACLERDAARAAGLVGTHIDLTAASVRALLVNNRLLAAAPAAKRRRARPSSG